MRGLEPIEGCLAIQGLDLGWLVISDRQREMFPIEARSPPEMHSTGQGRQMTIVHA
jgi:hypothetical protein